jgi:F0F1-type ATP synthase assembly protein I
MATSSSWKTAYRYGNVGLDLVLSIVVGFLLGRWVDRHFLEGHGYGTVIGTIIGVYAGFRSLYKVSKQAQRQAEAEDRRERDKADKDAKVAAYKKEVSPTEVPSGPPAGLDPKTADAEAKTADGSAAGGTSQAPKVDGSAAGGTSQAPKVDGSAAGGTSQAPKADGSAAGGTSQAPKADGSAAGGTSPHATTVEKSEAKADEEKPA